jgi:pantoate--beta-alanine ligase
MRQGFTPGELTVHARPTELAKVTRALRGVGRKIALVPTMGALHDGHLELIRRARRVPNTVVVVSIFLNPLQFGKDEDIERYPRTLDADLQACRAEGVELVFAPEGADMYPEPPRITVQPGPLGEEMEGAVRPGHFAGVLTVVAKLFNIVRPDFAFFGEKDYQQLVLIRQMVRGLDFEVTVVGVPTVRDPDGLALSSRNTYLSGPQRAVALALSAALTAGAHAGARGGQAVLDAAREVLAAERGLRPRYVELRGPGLDAAPEHGEARLLVAGYVGSTWLIDNGPVLLGNPEVDHSTAPAGFDRDTAVSRLVDLQAGQRADR